MILIIKFIDRAESIAFRVVSILILLMGVYAIYDSYQIYHNAQSKSAWIYKPEITEDNTIVYPDDLPGMVAWLTVDDTNIDYPIMHSNNNIEWLNKDPFGNYSLAGSIFLDMSCSPDFTDDYSLVYGHHMEGGVMFGSLDMYSDETYFDQHTTGTLIVGDKAYKLKIFAYIPASAKDEEIFSILGGDYDRLGFIREHASIYREPEDGRILAMSTCVDTSSYDRTVVIATFDE